MNGSPTAFEALDGYDIEPTGERLGILDRDEFGVLCDRFILAQHLLSQAALELTLKYKLGPRERLYWNSLPKVLNARESLRIRFTSVGA